MKISWRSLDDEFNKEFIGAYRDTVKKYNRDAYRNAPKKDDKLIVIVSVTNSGVELDKLKCITDDGEIKSFYNEYVDMLDSSTINKLKKRDYEWVESKREILEKFTVYSDVVNVLRKKSHKATRDKFWWTFREFDHSSVGRHVMRPKFSNMAILVEEGLPEIGYASDMSNTLSIGVVNEIGRYYLISPWESIIGPPKSQARPLDGLYGVGIAFDTYGVGGQIHYQIQKLVYLI